MLVKVTAIIPAAGQGRRMQAAVSKQYLLLAGLPLIVHTLQVFQREPLIEEILLVVGPNEVSWCQQEIVHRFGLTRVRAVLAGGRERQDSVYQGLRNLSENCRWVAVHDGARPLLTSPLLRRTITEAWQHGAAVAAVPVKDTVKIAGADQMVQTTLARDLLWCIQTPQVFNRDWLQEAYQQACKEGYYGTDDASLLERVGLPVKLVTGDYENLKVTTPEDLDLAEAILARRKKEPCR